MKLKFNPQVIDGATLVVAASEDDRCTAAVSRMRDSVPHTAIVMDYCEARDQGARDFMVSAMAKNGVRNLEIVHCIDSAPVQCLRDQIRAISRAVDADVRDIVFDISVIPRANLWMLLRWLADSALWDRAKFVYSEPLDYSAVPHLPLTYGLRRIATLAGEVGVPDCSRPLHLIMQLGYEGDQALAVYEETQPARVSLLIPDPPFRPEWKGRTEAFNAHLLTLVGDAACKRVDPLDPSTTAQVIRSLVGDASLAESPVACPLGTKPQLLGLFMATLALDDEPALLIPTPLRPASTARATGVGPSWILG